MPKPNDILVVVRDGGRSSRGRLIYTDLDGEEGRVCVWFSADGALDLAIGAQVELEFDDQSGAARQTASGEVMHHRRSPGDCHYHFELDGNGQAMTALLANRRRSLRVRPTVSAPVVVDLSTPQGEPLARVHARDVSETGMGLLVRKPEDPRLYSAPSLVLRVHLPGDPAPLDLRARLLVRRRAGSLVHYGLEFDAEGTPDFGAARARLAAWVVARQTGQPRARSA